MSWSFAYVNGELVEIYFEEDKGVIGYCSVNKDDYDTQKEKNWIKEDTNKYDFICEDGFCKNKVDGKVIPSLEPLKMTEEDFKKAKPLEEFFNNNYFKS